MEPAGNISSVLGVVLQAGKWLAAPIGRRFMYLYNYNTNFDNLQEDFDRLKEAKDRVERKVDAAERNVEEIEGNVKRWQENVENTIVQAERLIQDRSNNPRCLKGLCPDLKTRYKLSKKAFKLKRDDIGPLLLQEEKFVSVSYPSIPPEKNFDKLQDDLLKLKNARLKVQRKVEEAKNNEEEIEEDVKKWLEDVDSIFVKAEELIQNQSSIGTDRKTGYQYSKAASEIMADVIGPLLRQEERFDKVSYSTIQLSNYGKNFDKLGDDVSKLKNARLKVQRKIKEAKNNVEEIEEDVKKWLEDVDSIIVKAENLIENQSSIGTDCKTRCQNSKAASELMVDDIGPLLQQEERFDKVSHPTIHKEIWLRSNEDYLAFESRNFTLKNVRDALNDDNIYMIGIYGMGGLGKTTLVQEIGRQAMNDQLFDEMAFTEVTETLNIKKIQTEIAEKLGVKFNNESERTSKLYERLRNGKKILLILDNVWEDFDLRTVGIPSGVDHGGCKLLLTTRNLDVLEKMGSINNFGMNVLNQKEAWSLFKKMAGNVIQTHELNSLSNDVCKECGGLPIVIATVARALRNKRHQFEWEDALRELRAPSPTKFIGFLEKEYQKIAMSYKYLRDELKKTFLICSQMENDTSISDLFKHVVSLDILEGDNLTMEEARNRLDKVVKELQYSCLLLHGSTGRRFSMHDVIRAIAVTIAYKDHHVFTERNDVERVWKDRDELRKCTRISLHGISISQRLGISISQLLRQDLDCPDLEFFSMRVSLQYYFANVSLFDIPEDFFKGMLKLKVLNLHPMHQLPLPSSLGLLTNLQTLCLDWSRIESVVVIGKLKKLKVLSLQYSSIKELPAEIGQLTQLKLFDLSDCWGLKIIAPNVISKLLQLEEFHVKGCSIQWKVEILEELKLLSQLTSLELDIKDNKMLPKDFFVKELKRYKISVEFSSPRYVRNNNDLKLRMFKLNFNSTISLEDLRGIKNVKLLCLTQFSDVENSFNEFDTRKPLLNEKVIFTNLMALELDNIISEKIWDNQFPTLMSSSYRNLTRFILESCGNIKYVFPSSIAKNLPTLQHLEIKDCKILKEIVAEEGAKATDNFAFSQVIYLELDNLPKLTIFYPGIHILELPMLKRLMVKTCGKFTSKYLSFHENSFHISQSKFLGLEHKINHDLEVFELKDGKKAFTWQSQFKTLTISMDKSTNISLALLQRFENLEELILRWCHKLMSLMPFSTFFQNIKVLRIDYCSELMKLITPSIARSLEQLREMNIDSCGMLIEIVEAEEQEDSTTSTEIVFDNLKTLVLRNLTSLLCFCSGNYSFKFPSLEELNIGECPNMKIFSQGILSTPKLHKVNYESHRDYVIWEKIMEVKNEGNDLNKTIRGAYKKQDIFLDLKFLKLQNDNSTEICYNQRPNSFYQNLTLLILSGCRNIKYAFSSSIAKSLSRLQQLKIQNCKILEEIVAKEEGENAIVNFDFLNVTLLKLVNLPELLAFYPKTHTFKWPKLKELVVINCDKFTSKHMSFQENSEEGELHISEPKSLFLDDKVDSNWEELRLTLSGRDVMSIWEGGFQESFGKVKTLQLIKDEHANIPIQILHKFNSLEELILKVSLYEEIFSCGEDEEHSETLTKLKDLKLWGLFNLKCICKQDSRSNSILQNLDSLEVRYCHNLTTLFSSLASFENLRTLRIHYCNGMKNLMSSSTIKTLVRLENLSIRRCEMMIEVLTNEGDIEKCEVVFQKLKMLHLYDLESLTCFCFGDYTLKFPFLKMLFLNGCSKMKTFSGGGLSMPMLKRLNQRDYSESDIHTITQQLQNDCSEFCKKCNK